MAFNDEFSYLFDGVAVIFFASEFSHVSLDAFHSDNSKVKQSFGACKRPIGRSR